ncbi:glutathione S-transferase N-terminal domain-containing protein [Bradyrhizobium sp. ISRA463]|uniref:glutathione S-transferase N-terminal domain-containing protein n=1 Tax=Bradyrhizobium sp. ISRA463 TaxID=2866199 RepID=UPI0032B07442
MRFIRVTIALTLVIAGLDPAIHLPTIFSLTSMDARIKSAHDERSELPMQFFSFWRSLASFRVRIALNLKQVPAEVILVDIDADAHRAEAYRKINPQMALPALITDDGTVLVQSLAIIDYLDETYPTPPLLPADALGRARVRALALMVACEGHPLLTPRVRRYLDRELDLRDSQQAPGGGTGRSRRWSRSKATSPATRRPVSSATAMHLVSPTSAWSAMSPRQSTNRSTSRPGRP